MRIAENAPAGDPDVEVFQQDELAMVCAPGHPLFKRPRISFEECLHRDRGAAQRGYRQTFVGLNRGRSLLELTSRAAERGGTIMQVRVQVRSFDALCQMVRANLGIGILPVAVLRNMGAGSLRVVHLQEAWAQ